MAKQKGVLKLNGTIGDLTFYKSRDGFLLREKGGIAASRIHQDPAFQRTRENIAEFGRAGKGCKLLRSAFRALTQQAGDSRVFSRMMKPMMAAIQADAVNKRGQRTIVDGDVHLLNGFEFNQHARLETTCFVAVTTTIDRAAGTLSVSVPAFVPLSMISAPNGATHFSIVSGGAAIDFANSSYTVDLQDTGIQPWSATPTQAVTLENTVAAAGVSPLFLVLGVSFYQEVNGEMYPLMNNAFNALAIVAVDSN